MLRRVRGFVRGAVAWLAGTAATFAVLLARDADGTISEAVRTYVEAHALGTRAEPLSLLVIPVFVLGATGFRAGASLRAGVTGRIRDVVQFVRGTERKRYRTAVTGAGFLAVGYAALAGLSGAIVGISAVDAAVRGFVYGVVVCVPAALLGVSSERS